MILQDALSRLGLRCSTLRKDFGTDGISDIPDRRLHDQRSVAVDFKSMIDAIQQEHSRQRIDSVVSKVTIAGKLRRRQIDEVPNKLH